MKEFLYPAKIENGKLVFNQTRAEKETSVLEGKALELIIRQVKRNRSQQQNRYYWGVVVPMVQKGLSDLGDQLQLSETHSFLIDYLKSTSKDHTHQFLKSKFIEPHYVDKETGDIFDKDQSSKELSVTEFMSYVDEIIKFASQELKVVIPSPQDYVMSM